MKVLLDGFNENIDPSEEALTISPYCSCSFASPASCAFLPSFDACSYCSRTYSTCSFGAEVPSLCGTFKNPDICAKQGE